MSNLIVSFGRTFATFYCVIRYLHWPQNEVCSYTKNSLQLIKLSSRVIEIILLLISSAGDKSTVQATSGVVLDNLQYLVMAIVYRALR